MKSKLIKALIICVIVGGLGTGGYIGYKKIFSTKAVATTSAYVTAVASKMNMQVNIQGTGAAYSANTKNITSGYNGTISSLNVNVGDAVETGDKLFTVDSDQLSQNLTKAQSNLDKLKLQLSQAKNDDQAASINIDIASAQKDVATAKEALSKTTIKSPINGVVAAKNNGTGDNVLASNTILTVVDPTSIKIKVAVDELDIEKVKVGQTAEVKFDAIKDKVFGGTVEEIALTGNSSNNVTTYDVVVGIKDPAGIRLGMNANVNILVESKDNALVIPAEALVERNGRKFVMVAETASASSSTASGNNNQTPQQNGKAIGQNSNGGQQANGTLRMNRQRVQGANNGSYSASAGGGKLVEIKTGLENENYIEVLDGLTEGEKLLIALPQTTTTNSTTNRNAAGGNFGGFGGGMPTQRIQRASGKQSN